MATADDAPARVDLIRIAVRRASERHGVSFEHVVSIGDAPWDLETARELSLPFLAVGDRCGDASSGARTITDYVDGGLVLTSLETAACW
jgi:phosphoglycolate phosphatase-like HAD superfamily hydrolase